MAKERGACLWSTLKPNEIPGAGDIVTFTYECVPRRVLNRTRDEFGQVWLYFLLDGEQERIKIECINWYPQAGDVVVAYPGAYIRWVQQLIQQLPNTYKGHPVYSRWSTDNPKYRELKALMIPIDRADSWFYGEMKLLTINGDMAQVKPKSGEPHRMPINCLAVLKKGERKAL